MRNLKRALSLALAAAMLISLMVVGASAAENYGDEASISHTEAVDVLTGLGVVGGDQNGNFNPTATLTRAEFCVMIANSLTGGNFDQTLFQGTATPFTDVQGHWGASYIAYCYSVGVIAGTSATTFSPDVNTTRGMVVTMLYRLAGSPDVSGTELSFTDVAADSYCADAVAWASANDIVSGYSETTFGPDDSVTRDQLATILYRYAVSQGMDVTGGVELTAYTDADQVPAYSLEAMQWAVGTGLITGRSETTVAPLGTASRAEVATIFARFCQNNEG